MLRAVGLPASREATLTLRAASWLVGESRHLTAEETSYVVAALLTPGVDLEECARFLTAMAAKRPTVDEVVGTVRQLRASAALTQSVTAGGRGLLDIVGTGGDGSNSVNLSTIAALVAAAAGASVAKIGNRASTSRCGSADVLEALGVEVDAPVEEAGDRLQRDGFAFLHTQLVHPALARLAPVRRALGVPTIFNLVGPLASPAPVTGRLLGTANRADQNLLAEACSRLAEDGDMSTTWVVTGHGGVDELTTSGPARVLSVGGGQVQELVVDPKDLGLAPSRPADLVGGDVATNARIAREVLAGRGPRAVRETSLLNAAAGLHLVGLADDLADGLALAAAALDDGLGTRLIARLAHPSRRSQRTHRTRRSALVASAPAVAA